MLITNKLYVLRILRYTWRVDLAMILACTVSYYVPMHFFPTLHLMPPTQVTLLGAALAFFIGFNNNQAYDRWWEARTIWGALVNDSRTWTRNLLQNTVPGMMGRQDLAELRQRMVRRHIAFVWALNAALRRKPDPYFEHYITPEEVQLAQRESNLPNAILSQQAADLQKLAEAQALDAFRFVQMNQMLTAFTDHMGRSERIRTTVFPITYLYFTRLFIWLLVILATFTLADQVGAWSILSGWLIGFVFQVSHQNGMTLMDPFDLTPYGVPLNQISRTIEINLLQMLGEKDIPKPVEVIDGEYVL